MGRIPSAAALRGTTNTLPSPLRGRVQGGRRATSILSPSATARLPAGSIIRNIAGAASSHSLVVPQPLAPQVQPQPQAQPQAQPHIPAGHQRAIQPQIPAAAVTPQAVTVPPSLQRFIDAQMNGYKENATHTTALKEMQQGKKETHWSWYELPVVRGFGQSEMARHFSLNSMEEVRAYYANDTLRANLISMFESINSHTSKPIKEIMVSDVDAAKLQSCATIFYLITNDQVFVKTLDQFYDGLHCQKARQKFIEWQKNE